MKNAFKVVLGIMGIICLLIMGIVLIPILSTMGIVLVLQWFPCIIIFGFLIFLVCKIIKKKK